MARFREAPADDEPPDEKENLAALRAGDRAAAERLIAASYRQIYAALCRLCGGDSDLASDLTQETYRRAWEALSSFRGASRFSTWLYRIAYTTFLNHQRRPQRLLPLDEKLAQAVADPRPDGAERFAERQDRQRLRQAVLGLDDDLRFAVTARYWADLSPREIATLEGVSGVAIRKRLARALVRLDRALQENS